MIESDVLRVEFSHRDRVAHLVMTSPRNLNAMDEAMARAYREAREILEKSGLALRMIVVKGEGRAFSAGGDLEMLKQKAGKSVDRNEREMMEFYLSFLGLRDLHLPILSLLHGHVVGAGFCFSAACDLRVAASDTLLSAPFARLALHPGMGGSYFLARAFGSEVARELMLTGRRMPAEEAFMKGYVSRVVEPTDLSAAGNELIEQVLWSAPEATRALLVGERERERAAISQALSREAREQALCYARPEFLAGIEALQQKAAPPWHTGSF